VSGNPPFSLRRLRLSLFGVIGGVLALALLAVAAVQMRQNTLLNLTVIYQDDYVVLSLYQVETEYLRLREQWLRARTQGDDFDHAALQLRYDIWVSRVGLLHSERAMRLMLGSADYETPLVQINRFIQNADAMLGSTPTLPFDRGGLAALQAELDALSEPIHSMSLSAAHHVAAQITARNMAVRQHNQVGLLLTLFLSVLTLAFGLMAMRQMRQSGERQRSLIDLTGHLREARRQAESASDAKSVFLANMSHEIRTPFHGLLGMLSLLRDTGLNARQVDYLRTATESADHLLTILNDILDMSLLESGRMSLSEAPVSLRELLREVEALMRPLAQVKSLALHIDIDPGVPERAMADRTRVKQVLFNLLNNAVKFSDRGVVVLELRCVQDEAGVAQLDFVVTDTGIGMNDETLARLFQRFSQGDESRARRHGGAGLGLEISRSLARLMGGDVTASSVSGEGSTFRLRIPAHPVHDALPVAASAALPAIEIPGAARAPLRVLVAEDHPVNRQYMAALLEGMGHHTFFAGNGLEAVQAVREQAFDIVLMDLHMPLLDGVGATLSIRALPSSVQAAVPIIALTADAFAQTRERCLMAGMNDFLTKPVSPEKLSATLRRLFGAQGQSEAAAAAPSVARDASSARADALAPLLDRAALDGALRVMPRDRLVALLASFFEQGPEMVQRLRVALRDGQVLDLRVNAHAARGAALNFGLAALAQTAQALHEGATHVPAHEIARLVQRFEDQVARSREACEAAGLLEAVTG
jgi:signal transduction histidine kinase/DNA-binding response OmpR family regulator